LVFVSGPFSREGGSRGVTVVACVCCRGTRERLVLQLRLIEALPFLSLSSVGFLPALLVFCFLHIFFLNFSVFYFLFLSVCFFPSLSLSLSLSLSQSFSGAQEDQISFCRSCGSPSEKKEKT
jgi:hypothetical protein